MIKIRKIQIEDVDLIVSLHLESFPGFFLTSLGRLFLKCYYSCFVKSSETISVCAEENGKMLGFAVSTKVSKGFNGRLIKQNLVQFSLLFMKLFFTNPKALLRLVKNFSKTSDEVEDKMDYAELFSIGVTPSAQGKGVGSLLLSAIERIIISEGGKKISLTTDYHDNDSALKFYEYKGYSVLYEFVTYPNRRMFRMIKHLSQ